LAVLRLSRLFQARNDTNIKPGQLRFYVLNKINVNLFKPVCLDFAHQVGILISKPQSFRNGGYFFHSSGEEDMRSSYSFEPGI
jgi:hypothetical protein